MPWRLVRTGGAGRAQVVRTGRFSRKRCARLAGMAGGRCILGGLGGSPPTFVRFSARLGFDTATLQRVPVERWGARQRRRRVALLVLFAHAAGVARADADAPFPELSWSAPEGCPDEVQVQSRLRTKLAAWRGVHTPMRAIARVTRSGRGYRLVLDLQSDEVTAQKSLSVGSCEAAADAAVLLIELAWDPQSSASAEDPVEDESSAAQGHGTEGPSTNPPAEPEANGNTTATTPVQPQSARSAKPAAIAIRDPPKPRERDEAIELRASVGAAVTLDFTSLPQTPAWGVRPWIGLSLDRLHATAGLALLLPGGARSTELDAVIEGRAIGVDATLGMRVLDSPFTLVPHGTAELSRQSVVTSGLSDPASATASWLAFGVGVHAAWALGTGLELTLDPAVCFPVDRPRWLVRTSGGDVVAYQASEVGLRVGLGLAYTFP